MNVPSACVVLPAAGIGERMGIVKPKQFCEVLNKPLISYTIESFERLLWISHIIVIVTKDCKSYMCEILNKFMHTKVSLVEGASSRHRSIYNGIVAIETVCPQTEVVIIHDGVRPFVDEETILAVTLSAMNFGAAGAVRPLVSTVIAMDQDGFLCDSLDRSKYRASEMPQAFKYEIIKRAYEKSTEHDLDYGTECLDLVRRYTEARVRLLEGPDNLWKVTHRKDLLAAESLLKASVGEVTVIFLSGQVLSEIVDGIGLSLSTSLHQLVPVVGHTALTYESVSPKECKSASYAAVVFVHQDIDTFSAVEPFDKIDSSSPSVVVHVARLQDSHGDPCCQMSRLMGATQQSAKAASEKFLVAGILVKDEDLCWKKAHKIIASLIIERNNAFTGQTFLCC